ncbi:MAG: carboxypeptidase-like regulatory domain-containing protein [Bacillota bacterium]
MGKKFMYMLLLMVCILSSAIGDVNAAPTKNTNIAAVKESKSVKGTIKEGATSLINTQVLLREKGKSNWIHTVTDANGSFKTALEDSTYAVKGVKGKNNAWYSTSENFVVSDGKINSLNEGEIILSKKEQAKKPQAQSSNFNGVLKEGSNGLKADLILSKYSEYEEEFYTVSSKGNGSFSASLPDGTYFLFGVQVDDSFYRYEVRFTVEGGKVLVGGEQQTNLLLSIPANAYNGKVADSSASLSEATIVLEKRLSDEEYDNEFIQNVVTNKKGEFSFRALTDGTYSISVYHDTYSSWNDVTFEVVNGTTYVAGVKVSSLQVTVPDLNVKGTLLEGTKPIANGYVFFEGETSEGEYNGYGMPVDSKGYFQYRLKEGIYVVTLIEEQNRSTRVNISFEIRDGKLLQDGEIMSTLTISLPTVTLSGKLMESGAALQGAVYVEKVSDDGSYEWYYATTDENGVYSLRLKDGSYQVTGGHLYEEGEEVVFYTTFDIINGKLFVDGKEQSLLELQVPPVTLHGYMKDGDQAVTGGYVSVSSEIQGFYSWKSLNSDGTFTMRLADGNYTVVDVQLEDGTTAYIEQSFSIVDGKTYVNGELQDELEMTVPPITVTGTLTDAGNPIMGNLYIMEINEADHPLQAWGWTNEEGRFQFRLPDGDYKVYDVYLYDGTTYSPGTEFSIVSGQLYVNGELTELLNIAVEPITLSGTVYHGEELVTEGYVAVTSLDGNWSAGYPSWIQNGSYHVRLPDGEYQISLVEDFQKGTFHFSTAFMISGGKLFVDGQEVSALDINLQDGWQ